MNNNEIDIRWKKELKEYCRKWLDNYKSQAEAAKFIETIYESTDWEIKAIENAPEDAAEVILPDQTEEDKFLLIKVKTDFPMPARFTFDYSPYNSLGTSGSTGVYHYVVQVGQIPTC